MDSILSLKVDHRGFVSEHDRDNFFRHQFKLPENTKCFDCGFNNPKWTSISFSIYLCLNCSGRHRQMGSHISFVRSVDMDRFTRDQLVRLYLGGNGEFASYLYTENLLQRPLNYTNKKILSYTSRLDTLLAKYVDKKSPKSETVSKDNVGSTQSVNKETESMANKSEIESQLQTQHLVATDRLESTKNTESSSSSIRDDAEKMNKLRSDAFGDLMDLISIGSQDSKARVPTNVVSDQTNQHTLESTVTQVKNDILDVFENFESVPQSENRNYKFDSISEFVNMPVGKFDKTNTNDSMLNLDLSNSSVPSVTGSFSNLTVGTNQYKSNNNNKEYYENKDLLGLKEDVNDTEEFKDALEYVKEAKKTGKPRGSRNKFSSKANNFDFETFEKENTVQFALQPTTVVPDTCSFTDTPNVLLPKVPSCSSLPSTYGSGLYEPTSAFQSSSVSSNTPLKASAVSLGSHQSPQPGRLGPTGPSSYLNTNLNISPKLSPNLTSNLNLNINPNLTGTGNTSTNSTSNYGSSSLLTKHGVQRNKFQSVPDLSKFEGKKAISSDAFFGVNQSQGSSTPCVNPDAHAFSSDQYFGRPKQENKLVVPSIEEQAMQNLNELKENIVSAINKGGVLFEKAKQWLNTNYY